MDADDLMQRWRNQKRMHSIEGDSGLEKMETLFEAIGYGHQFRWGDPVQAFLSDNPGACEAILEWFEDILERNQEWQAALAAELGEDGEDDEEEEEEDDECGHPGNFNQTPEGMVCLDCMKVVLG